MNPKWLKIQAFGPFADSEYIDFDKLKNSGLFLIYGKTGAGKTSIFDAMTCALYGQACDPGRGGILKLRCQYATLDTLVEFCFEVKDKTYVFVCATRKKRGSEQSVEQVAAYELVDEQRVPLMSNFKHTEVVKAAREIIGLSYEQFCRVVLLPQGKFEQLLLAKAKDKEDILKTLFGTQRYQDAADNLYALATERASKLKEEERLFLSILEPTGESSVEALAAKVQMQRQACEATSLEMQEKHNLFTVKSAEFERANLLLEQFSALEKLSSEKNEMLALEPEMNALERTCAAVQSALQIRPLWEGAKQKKRRMEERKSQNEGNQSQERLSVATFEKIKIEQAGVKLLEAEQEQLKLLNADYKNKLGIARKNGELTQQINKNMCEWRKLEG